MRKRLLSVLLCCSLVCSTLVGCGKKEVAEPTMPSVGELADESVTTESSGEEVSSEEGNTVDYSTAYDDYFDTWKMPNDNIEMAMHFKTSNGDLSESAFSIKMSGDNVALVGETDDNCIGFYAVGNDMYFNINVNSGMLAEEGGSAENGWYVFHKTEDTSDSVNTDEVTSMADEMTDFDSNSIVSVKYLNEVEEDGVVYDRLTVSVKDTSEPNTNESTDSTESSTESSTEDASDITEYTVYINRDTQFLTKMSAIDESTNTEVLIVFSEIDSVELPNFDGDAKELTEEEALSMMMSTMFGAVMMAMQEDMLNNDMSDSDITVEPAEGVTVVE